MPYPTIQELPPAPQRGDTDFSEKANAHVAALTPWTQDVNAAGQYIEEVAGGIGDNVQAAADAALLSQNWATTTDELVAETGYSSKEWAQGAIADSAKRWATELTEITGGLKGARGYAQDARESADSAGIDAARVEAVAANMPEGSINDSITTLTDTWSSQKISEGVSEAGTKAILTQSFLVNQQESLSLSYPTSGAAMVSVTKEVPQLGITNDDWGLRVSGANYDAEDTAYATTLTPSATTGEITLSLGTGAFTAGDLGKTITGNGGSAVLVNEDGSAIVTATFTDTSAVASGNWAMREAVFTIDSVTLQGDFVIKSTENAIPAMTSNTAPSGTVEVSSFILAGWMAFDQNDETLWLANSNSNEWISYQFAESKGLWKYQIKANAGGAPRSFSLQGFNGSSWVILDSKSGINFSSSAELKEFVLPETIQGDIYEKFRLFINTTDTGDTIRVIELKLFEAERAPALTSRYIPVITNNLGQIDSTFWTDINNAASTESLNGQTVLYSLSTDGRTTFHIVKNAAGARSIARLNAGIWEVNTNATYNLETWSAASENTVWGALRGAMATPTNQMPPNQLAAAAGTDFPALGNELDLAITLYTDDATQIPSSQGVTLNYDANVLNQGAINGTDYEWDQPDSTTVRIKSLQANNLKVRVV